MDNDKMERHIESAENACRPSRGQRLWRQRCSGGQASLNKAIASVQVVLEFENFTIRNDDAVKMNGCVKITYYPNYWVLRPESLAPYFVHFKELITNPEYCATVIVNDLARRLNPMHLKVEVMFDCWNGVSVKCDAEFTGDGEREFDPDRAHNAQAQDDAAFGVVPTFSTAEPVTVQFHSEDPGMAWSTPITAETLTEFVEALKAPADDEFQPRRGYRGFDHMSQSLGLPPIDTMSLWQQTLVLSALVKLRYELTKFPESPSPKSTHRDPQHHGL